MMKRSFRDRWIELLESDEFTQTKGILAKDDDTSCRCCLGVAYDVKGQEIRKNPNSFKHIYAYLPGSLELNDWGITYDDAIKLSDMNDDGMSFNDIAAYIKTMDVEDD